MPELFTNQEFLTAIVSAIVGVTGGYFTYKGISRTSKKEESISDRQQLSQDEQKFRDDLYDRMKILEEQVEKYMKLVDRYHEKSIALEEEVLQWKNKYVELDKEWRFKYTELEMENKQLQNKVFVMESRFKKMNDNHIKES